MQYPLYLHTYILYYIVFFVTGISHSNLNRCQIKSSRFYYFGVRPPKRKFPNIFHRVYIAIPI